MGSDPLSSHFHTQRLNIQDNVGLFWFVIPGLTRNPVFFWIPAFAGMTSFADINVAVHNSMNPCDDSNALHR
jgi:hypothetical protein